LELEPLKKKLMGQLGLAAGCVAALWGLWAFGLEDSLTAGMSRGAAHALQVLVAAGVAVLALLWPGSVLLNTLAEHWRRLDSELGKTERRYRSIVESTHDIILEINEEGNIVFANPAVKLLGYERDQVLGKPVKSLVPESSREKALPRITTRRIGPRATMNYPLALLTNEESVLSAEIDSMDFLIDACGLWKEPDEIVRTKGLEKHYLGTLIIARTRVENE